MRGRCIWIAVGVTFAGCRCHRTRPLKAPEPSRRLSAAATSGPAAAPRRPNVGFSPGPSAAGVAEVARSRPGLSEYVSKC